MSEDETFYLCDLCMGDYARAYKREECTYSVQIIFPQKSTINICRKCGGKNASVAIPKDLNEVVQGAVIEYPAPKKHKTKEQLLKEKEDWMDGD